MEHLDHQTINDLKTQRITDLIDQVVTDTALAVLNRLADKKKHCSRVICYKHDCPLRDDIPF